MLIEDKDQGKNEDTLAFLMTDLENDRKKYYQDLENFVEKVMKNITVYNFTLVDLNFNLLNNKEKELNFNIRNFIRSNLFL